ncbi:DUF2887 domain-containing protein [Desulfococcaceae bacterium HSG9]|nr:DUF2887 domain-containing protein [Desulfococcaceae bacterium HSG9]
MTDKKKVEARGTDEPFLRLMGIGGAAVLKLLGVAPEEAEEYTFRSVVLKDKRMEPDTEGLPVLEGRGRRVYIEFQGYADKFIRYRLVSRIMLACAQDEYADRVLGGIVYTAEVYKKAALPVKAFGDKAGEVLGKAFEEIVLTNYTEAMLTEIDSRLIVLAPFTVSPETNKTELLTRGRRWKHKIKTAYTEQSVMDALNITGLFIMNRFRDITREEVISMLNFDLRDTVAGQQIFDAGRHEGVQKGILKNARIMVIEALTERFIAVPPEIKKALHSVGNHDMLKELLRHAIRSPYIEDFKEILAKVLASSKTEKTPDMSD